MLISLPEHFIDDADGYALLNHARRILDNSDETVTIDLSDCHIMAGHAPNILASLFTLYPITMLRQRLQIINPGIHASQIKQRIANARQEGTHMSLDTFPHNTRLWQEYTQNLHLRHIHQEMTQILDTDIPLLKADIQNARDLATLDLVERHALAALDYQLRSYEHNQSRAKTDPTRRRRVAAHYARDYMAEAELNATDPRCLIQTRTMLLGLAIGATPDAGLQPPSRFVYNALFALADSIWAQREVIQHEWAPTD